MYFTMKPNKSELPEVVSHDLFSHFSSTSSFSRERVLPTVAEGPGGGGVWKTWNAGGRLDESNENDKPYPLHLKQIDWGRFSPQKNRPFIERTTNTLVWMLDDILCLARSDGARQGMMLCS